MGNYDAIKGKKIILLWRLLSEATTKKGAKLTFQTEHSVEQSKDSETTITKDGPITTSKGMEEEIPFNFIAAREDAVIDMLKGAMRSDEVLELWEVDTSKADASGDNKYPAIYRQGMITELNKSANAEDLVEYEGTFKTNGLSQTGLVTLTPEQAEIVQYKFRDLDVVEGA